MRALLGITALIFIAWLLSTDRRRFPVRIVVGGLVLQWILALAVLKTETGRAIFDGIGVIVQAILHGADASAEFVFGPLAGSNPDVAWPAIVGIKIMTTIITVATLSAVGYHYGILQRVVAVLAAVMRRAMGLGGAESLAAAANVFFGQTEAPLVVKPYISRMSRSELMALMTGGFATAAAGVMAVYVSILSAGDADLAISVTRHILTAALMSAPAAFVMAKVMVPAQPADAAADTEGAMPPRETHNLVDALTHGAGQGMKLAINVLAMLLAFIALISIVDAGLVWFGERGFMQPALAWLGFEQLNLDSLLGLVFSPLAWLLGAEWSACRSFGGLLGKAMATNEIIAYGDLAAAQLEGRLSPRAMTMATYCLCGFANLSSIGIQIGGIGILAPDRRADLIALGPRAMLGGAMACWMTGAIAGMLIPQ